MYVYALNLTVLILIRTTTTLGTAPRKGNHEK